MKPTLRAPSQRVLSLTAAVAILVAAVTLAGTTKPADAATKITFTGGQLAAPYRDAREPSLMTNGNQTLVVWSEKVNGTYGIYGRITSADTTSIGGRITIHWTDGHDSTVPDVAWNGERWFVVWEYAYSTGDRDILGAFVGTTRSTGGAIGVMASSADQRDPALDDTRLGAPVGGFLVAFEQGHANDATDTDVWYRRVTSAGGVGAPARASTDTVADPSNDLNPDVAYTHHIDEATIVWEAQSASSSMIQAWSAGTTPTPPVIVSSPWYQPVNAPAISEAGDAFMVVYEYNQGGPTISDIWAASISNSEVRTFPVSQQRGSEREPALADNDGIFVVWRDRRRDGGGDIYGARLSHYRVLDPDGVLITEYTPLDERPAITGTIPYSDSFGVAWQATPSGSGSGVITYGFSYAPK